MKNLIQFILIGCFFFYSCNMKPDKNFIEKLKKEIFETEQSFAEMAKEEGIHKAFISYAAEDAVLMRNNNLVVGKKNIDLFYKNQTSKDLTWKPDFVDVSESGDLAYTYGHYTYTVIDTNSNTIEYKGVFHTVWKRQPDGNWRFVWD